MGAGCACGDRGVAPWGPHGSGGRVNVGRQEPGRESPGRVGEPGGCVNTEKGGRGHSRSPVPHRPRLKLQPQSRPQYHHERRRNASIDKMHERGFDSPRPRETRPWRRQARADGANGRAHRGSCPLCVVTHDLGTPELRPRSLYRESDGDGKPANCNLTMGAVRLGFLPALLRIWQGETTQPNNRQRARSEE